MLLRLVKLICLEMALKTNHSDRIFILWRVVLCISDTTKHVWYSALLACIQISFSLFEAISKHSTATVICIWTTDVYRF